MFDIHVIAVGDFGHEVARRLADTHDAVVSDGPLAAESSLWPRSELQVVATWRDTPALHETADAYAFVTGRPWLPVTLDSNALRVGPLLGRGGPCRRCLLARGRQHRRHGHNDDALFARYDADPTAGPGGYLGAHVRIAVATVARIAAAVGAGAAGGVAPAVGPGVAGGAGSGAVAGAVTVPADGDELGRIRQFGLLQARATTDRLIPVDGCPRCGDHAYPDRSTWRRLARDLDPQGVFV